jgi:hypothetical protein
MHFLIKETYVPENKNAMSRKKPVVYKMMLLTGTKKIVNDVLNGIPSFNWSILLTGSVGGRAVEISISYGFWVKSLKTWRR